MRIIKFNKSYFLAFILLFITEVLIAAFLNDPIIRPYVGDLLVVILMYCFIKAFFKVRILAAAIGVLIFAYLVELSQYLNLIKLLDWQQYRLAHLILGSSFEWIDMIAYTLGYFVILLFEKFINKKPLFTK